MTAEQTLKFMENDYCKRTGKELSELSEYEHQALKWAVDEMKSECLIIQGVHEALDVFPPKVYVADFIAFPLQYLSDDKYDGKITKETGIIGARFFLYDAPDDGCWEDIHAFVEAYRANEKDITTVVKG